MPSPNDRMRRALKKWLLPALAARGFGGGALHFRRAGPEALDLLSLQWGKYGGEFILEFGCRPRGPLHTSWGEIVPEDKLDVAHLHPLERARLQPADDVRGAQLHGFFFGDLGEDQAAYEGLAQAVAAHLDQVDAWLRDGKVGSHIHPLKSPG